MGGKPKLLLGRYVQGELLGEGNFAKVYHARHAETGEEVAIKVMDKAKLVKMGAEKQIKREIAVMALVRHPNVVRLHEVMATRSRIFVVMEYVSRGPLYSDIPVNGYSEDDARRIFQQLVSVLSFCHAVGVYHRDIKPENLLLDEHRNLKVADFGLSALADTVRREALLHTVCGTPLYVPPEVFSRKGYDGAKADVWAAGVVLFVLAAGRKPFRDDALFNLYRTICRCEYRCPRWFSPDLVLLVRRLLQPDPACRITIQEIMETRWFNKGFKEINFYIDNNDRLRSLNGFDEPELYNSDSDTTVSSSGSSSPLAGPPRGMHTSASAPSLTELEKTDNAAEQPRMRRPKSLNAFDIIASSPSFDLSGLFEERGEQMRFVSAAPVPNIISKLQEIAGQVSFTARTREFQVSFEATRNGQKGALAISTKIFELTPELVMVQVCKKAGDTAEYRQFCHNELKPGLRGLVDGLLEKEASAAPPTLNDG